MTYLKNVHVDNHKVIYSCKVTVVKVAAVGGYVDAFSPD